MNVLRCVCFTVVCAPQQGSRQKSLQIVFYTKQFHRLTTIVTNPPIQTICSAHTSPTQIRLLNHHLIIVIFLRVCYRHLTTNQKSFNVQILSVQVPQKNKHDGCWLKSPLKQANTRLIRPHGLHPPPPPSSTTTSYIYTYYFSSYYSYS